MDEKEKPKEGVGTDLVAGATGATVGLATLTLLTPAVGVEPAAVAAGAMSGATSHLTKRVLSFVADAWNKRTGRKTQKLIESVAKIQSKSADDVAEELIPIIDDDSASEPVWRTVRAAIETPDDAAITPLATLLNMYRGQNPPKTVDVFFRGMTRMLSECDAEGLADLRAAVAASRLDSGEFPPRTIVTADRERLGGPLTVAGAEAGADAAGRGRSNGFGSSSSSRYSRRRRRPYRSPGSATTAQISAAAHPISNHPRSRLMRNTPVTLGCRRLFATMVGMR
jgi:hypothetical protein